MIIRLASHKIEFFQPGALTRLEEYGRVCWKSECRIKDGSASAFVRMICKKGHESVLEHAYATVRFIVDRGVSHELVRHRLTSISQESTRYVAQNREHGIEVILPSEFRGVVRRVAPTGVELQPVGEIPSFELREAVSAWLAAMVQADSSYFTMLALGVKPQVARIVLPHSLKTELVMTANMREWRHIFRLRCSNAAHPHMREVMGPLREEFQERIPEIFGEDVA